MKDLEGKKCLLKELLAGEHFYRIPEYQRPFSWEQENFEDLIQDLLDAEKEQEYFLGTVVLHSKMDDHVYDVVDGQQRLTTLMILFACLRDLITNEDFKNDIQEKITQKGNVVDGIPEKHRIEVRDREIFNELIVPKDGTLKEKEKNELHEPQWRYIEAIKIFKTKLTPLSQPELQKFIQFVSQKCIMIFLSTTTFDDAFKLFTIVNDRGKQLRRMDILKAKNIAPDIISAESVRNSLAQKWEEWEKNLGEETFESVLYLLRFILLEEKPYNDLLFEFEEKIFKKGKLTRGEKFIETVFSYCALYSEIFEDFTYFDDNANKIKVNSLLYIMTKELKSYEWKACLLQYVKKYKDQSIEQFLYLIELKYLETWMSGINKDKRNTIFGAIIKTINNSTKPEDIFNSSTIKVDIDYLKKKLEEDLYGKSYAKYILLRLELIASEHVIEKKFEAKSIEHILPQTIPTGSDWATWFNDPDKNKWVNKLANLVLLSKSKNSSARNFSFAEKKQKYLNKRVSDYPRSIQILTMAEWTPTILQQRQQDLINEAVADIFN